MTNMLISFFKNEDGVTAMEYGMIAALIAVAIIFAVGNIGQELKTTFETIETELTNANNP